VGTRKIYIDKSVLAVTRSRPVPFYTLDKPEPSTSQSTPHNRTTRGIYDKQQLKQYQT